MTCIDDCCLENIFDRSTLLDVLLCVGSKKFNINNLSLKADLQDLNIKVSLVLQCI